MSTLKRTRMHTNKHLGKGNNQQPSSDLRRKYIRGANCLAIALPSRHNWLRQLRLGRQRFSSQRTQWEKKTHIYVVNCRSSMTARNMSERHRGRREVGQAKKTRMRRICRSMHVICSARTVNQRFDIQAGQSRPWQPLRRHDSPRSPAYDARYFRRHIIPPRYARVPNTFALASAGLRWSNTTHPRSRSLNSTECPEETGELSTHRRI